MPIWRTPGHVCILTLQKHEVLMSVFKMLVVPSNKGCWESLRSSSLWTTRVSQASASFRSSNKTFTDLGLLCSSAVKPQLKKKWQVTFRFDDYINHWSSLSIHKSTHQDGLTQQHLYCFLHSATSWSENKTCLTAKVFTFLFANKCRSVNSQFRELDGRDPTINTQFKCSHGNKIKDPLFYTNTTNDA